MKKIRVIGMILAHIGLVLSIAYLIFFMVCTARADKAAERLDNPETAASVSAEDRHLEHSMRSGDFSLLSVGKALSEKDDPGRETALLIVDLIIPALCLASGILLQIASVRKKRRRAVSQRPAVQYQSSSNRR